MFKIISGKDIEPEIEKIKKQEVFDRAKERQVEEILEKVKMLGDEALVDFTKQFDGVEISDVRVSKDEIESAYKKVKKDFISSIQNIGKNITEFHKRQKEEEWFEQLSEDAVMGMRNIPVESVGMYVPGGRAVYPSSVLMNAIPAKVAGVSRIVMVSPPPIDPHVLVSAEELGVSEIYKVGGAQAIGALAFGTKTIKRVDKIVGPAIFT